MDAAFRGRARLAVLLAPLGLALLRPGGLAAPWPRLGLAGALCLWWAGAAACLPPTRPLWRFRAPGPSRRWGPVLFALLPGVLAAWGGWAFLAWCCAPVPGLAGGLLRLLAVQGALLLGHAVCLACFARLRPSWPAALASAAALAACALWAAGSG